MAAKRRRIIQGRKTGGGVGLPPYPKTPRPHLVTSASAWVDLERELRANSAHGRPREIDEPRVETVSGLDMRRRIYALGFTVTKFARRHGMSAASFYEMTHYPAGAIYTKVIRLLEFEEFLDGVATVIEDESLDADAIRARLEAMLTAQAARL